MSLVTNEELLTLTKEDLLARLEKCYCLQGQLTGKLYRGVLRDNIADISKRLQDLGATRIEMWDSQKSGYNQYLEKSRQSFAVVKDH